MPAPADDQAREGGCFCGAVRFRLVAATARACICHCRSCRKAAGAPSVAWLTVPAAGFAWVLGTPAAHRSAPGVVRRHCAACGTSLTWEAEPGLIDVTIASLDDPEAVPPASEIWLAHRLSWEAVDPQRPGSEEA